MAFWAVVAHSLGPGQPCRSSGMCSFGLEVSIMGRWDSGIFDGDEAQELLGDVLEPLVNTVRLGLPALGFGNSNDFQYAKNVIPAVACLRHLATAINKNGKGLRNQIR